MSLKITISGVRGIYGETLTDKVATDFALAFGKFIGDAANKKVVVGYDTRLSLPNLREAIYKGLAANNIEIIDIGIVPTPTVQIITKKENADGGIMITASHNPKEWNGLKFIRPDGIFLNEQEANYLISLYEEISKTKSTSPNLPREINFQPKLKNYHLEKIYAMFDIFKIKKSGLKVVIDAANGAGTIIDKIMFDDLNIDYTIINEEPKGDFNRSPEPIPENLKELSAKIKELNADIGFAQDADADRLAIVDETGNPIGEDNTLVLASDYLLSLGGTAKKIIVTNLSTTRAIDDIAIKHQATVIRTKIGEVNVSETIKKENAIAGGEGNGGVIIPEIGFGRDSLAGMLAILSLMVEKKKKLSEIVAETPKYHMLKDKIPFNSDSQLKEYLQKTKEIYANEEIDEMDGIKIIFKDKNWLHIRSSNTEPIIRIISEAETKEKAIKLVESLKKSLA